MQLQGPLDIAVSAASAYFGGKKTGGSPSSGSSLPGITVSPAFQQAFTPQFSPVMQQQQDSPGGTQAATPIQYATAGQTARTGEGMPGAGPAPSMPYIPQSGPISIPEIPTVQQTDKYTGLIQTGILVAGLLAGISMWQGKRGKGGGRKIAANRSRKRKSKKK